MNPSDEREVKFIRNVDFKKNVGHGKCISNYFHHGKLVSTLL
jgi:hypothetical protein